jgi:hypothetical protein
MPSASAISGWRGSGRSRYAISDIELLVDRLRVGETLLTRAETSPGRRRYLSKARGTLPWTLRTLASPAPDANHFPPSAL